MKRTDWLKTIILVIFLMTLGVQLINAEGGSSQQHYKVTKLMIYDPYGVMAESGKTYDIILTGTETIHTLTQEYGYQTVITDLQQIGRSELGDASMENGEGAASYGKWFNNGETFFDMFVNIAIGDLSIYNDDDHNFTISTVTGSWPTELGCYKALEINRTHPFALNVTDETDPVYLLEYWNCIVDDVIDPYGVPHYWGEVPDLGTELPEYGTELYDSLISLHLTNASGDDIVVTLNGTVFMNESDPNYDPYGTGTVITEILDIDVAGEHPLLTEVISLSGTGDGQVTGDEEGDGEEDFPATSWFDLDLSMMLEGTLRTPSMPTINATIYNKSWEPVCHQAIFDADLGSDWKFKQMIWCPLRVLADLDIDGKADTSDNCKYVYNPDQTDADSNGVGDDCENKIPFSTTQVNVTDSYWSAAEWSDAKVIELDILNASNAKDPYGLKVYIYEKYDNDYVYMAADYISSGPEANNDYFEVNFDLNNDESFECDPDINMQAGSFNEVGNTSYVVSSCDEEEDLYGASGLGSTENKAEDHRFIEMKYPIENFRRYDESGAMYWAQPWGKAFRGQISQVVWTYPFYLGDVDFDEAPDKYLDAYLVAPPTLTQKWSQSFNGGVIYDLDLLDVNADNVSDIIVAEQSAEDTVYALDGKNGSIIWQQTGVPNARSIAWGYFRESGEENPIDRYLGIVAGTSGDSEYDWYILNATNGEIIKGHTIGCRVTDMETFDLNSDGISDIVVADDCETGTIQIYNGTKTSNKHEISIDAFEVAVGDIDGDGNKDDLAFGNAGGEIYTYTYNDPYGTWTEHADDDFDADANAVDIADVDGDGLADTVAGWTDGYVRMYLGEDSSVDYEVALDTEIKDVKASKGLVVALTEDTDNDEETTIYFMNASMDIIHQGRHVGDNGRIVAQIEHVEIIERNGYPLYVAAITEDERVYLYSADGTSKTFAGIKGRPGVIKVGKLETGLTAIVTAANNQSGVVELWTLVNVQGEPEETITVSYEEESDGSTTVELKKDNSTDRPIVEINIPLGQSLNLSNLTIENRSGLIVVSGLDLPENVTKTVTLETRQSGSLQVCLNDNEGASSISSTCNQANETKLTCPGTYGQYTCTKSGTEVTVTGLNHSALGTFSTSSPSGSSGGGGGGGGSYAYSNLNLAVPGTHTFQPMRGRQYKVKFSNYEFLFVVKRADPIQMEYSLRSVGFTSTAFPPGMITSTIASAGHDQFDFDGDGVDDFGLTYDKASSTSMYHKTTLHTYASAPAPVVAPTPVPTVTEQPKEVEATPETTKETTPEPVQKPETKTAPEPKIFTPEETGEGNQNNGVIVLLVLLLVGALGYWLYTKYS